MNSKLKYAMAICALAVAVPVAAQVTFYEREGYEGRSFTAENQIGNFEQVGFNDRASSAVVMRGRWEICEQARFGGRCVVLRPGRYPSLAAMGLGDNISSVRTVSRDTRLEDNRYAPVPAAPQITFYSQEGFGGRTFTTDKQIGSFERHDFNDRASSVVVSRDFWEACEDAWFGGRCVVLRPGRYPSLSAMGLSDSISSVRIVGANERVEFVPPAPAPAPVPVASKVTFYEHEGYGGRFFVSNEQVENFERFGFNDRASSVVVTGEPREVCEHARFGGRCVVLRPGSYPSLAAMGLNDRISSMRAVRAGVPIEDNRNLPPPVAQVTFYEREGFAGRSFSTQEQINNLERFGFNDRASSAIVVGEPREVCEDVRFNGRCVVLSPGRYPSLAAMGLRDRISSVRAVAGYQRADIGR